MDNKGQVSVELLVVIGVMIALAVAFLSQVRSTATGFSGKLNETSGRAMDLLDKTGFEP